MACEGRLVLGWLKCIDGSRGLTLALCQMVLTTPRHRAPRHELMNRRMRRVLGASKRREIVLSEVEINDRKGKRQRSNV